MTICDPGNLFQSKLDKIINDVEGVKTYIDDILVFKKLDLL